MEIWKNKVAIVTGAGQGIGAKISEDLVKIGMKVIGFEATEVKTIEMLENVSNWGKLNGQFIPCKCDISNDEDLKNAFQGIVAEYGGVDLLINNAAIGQAGYICTGNLQTMSDIINVNIYGMMACTRLAIDSMKKRGTQGQIINLNSICGHYMPSFAEPKINMYIASKKAMTAFNDILQKENELAEFNIRMTSISPGIVKTGLFKSSNVQFINEEYFDKNPHLAVNDVSNTVLMILSAPRNVHVKEVMLHALHENY